MNTRKVGLFTVGALVTAGLCLGGTVAANASTVDNAKISSTTASSTGSTYTVVAKNLTDGATATVKLTGSNVSYTTKTTKTVNDDGEVSYTFAVTKAGVYKVRFSADGETVTKSITVGDAFVKATVEAESTNDKTTTIEGTAAANSTVKVIVRKDGDIVSDKNITVDSSGDYSTTFKKATEDGKYTVTVKYITTATEYGSKSYTDTFWRK